MNWCRMRPCLHSIYVIDGPSGAYVGNTIHPEKRRYEHWHRAAGRPGHVDLRIHTAMRQDGASRYRFRVVGMAAGCMAAVDFEHAVIRQLRGDRRRVLNVQPIAEASR